MPKRYLPHLLNNYTPVLKPKPAPILASIVDEPTVEVEISYTLIPYLLGLLEIYRWPDRLRGDPADVQNAVGLFQDLRVALTEGNVRHIKKEPSEALYNTITAPSGYRGLYIIQQGGEYPLVASQEGNSGRVALLAMSNLTNTDPLLVLDRAAQNGDFLSVKPGAGNTYTAINRYGQITMRFYQNNLPTADQYTLGSLALLLNSSSPSTFPDGAYIGMQSGASYFWARFKGQDGMNGQNGTDGTIITDALGIAVSPGGLAYANLINHPTVSGTKRLVVGIPIGADGRDGRDGQTGPTGHGLDLLDPALQAVLKPNQNPEIVIDDALPAKTFIGFKIPRAQKLYFLPTLTGLPGTAASAATSLDTNGDLNVQLTIPAGADGTGSGVTLDDQPPAEGQTKSYSQMIDANGTYIPFKLNTGYTIIFHDPKGRWQVTRDSTVDYIVCDAYGHPTIDVEGSTQKAGRMLFNAYGGASDITLHDAFSEYEAVNEGEDIFVAAHSYHDLLRRGQILVQYDIFRPYTPRTDFFRLAILQSSPDRYWRCNELSGGNLIDLIANHTLALSGSYSLAQTGAYSGDDHRSVRFNGGQAKGDPLSFLAGDGAYTIEALVKMGGRTAWFWHGEDNSTTGDLLAGYASGYGVGHYWNGGGSNVIAALSSPNSWNHLVLTYDPSGSKYRRVYLNGQQIAEGVSPTRNTPTTSHTWLGRDYFQGSDCYLSEVAIYSAPLASNVVADHYNAFQQSIQGHA